MNSAVYGHDPGVDSTFVFDVNETLLDSSALDEFFASAFGSERVRQEWFAQLLQRALICNAIGEYYAFPELAAMALDQVAARYGKEEIAERAAILERFTHMPAHADVTPALEHLKKGGVRLAALTNSPKAGAERALTSAGIRDLFDRVLSVEEVRCFKPDRRVYEMAAQALDEAPSRLWLVSCHWWDCLGASRLGWKTALVRRSGSYNDGLMVRPVFDLGDLHTLARELDAVTAPRAF